jgi:hypothetical protein
MINNSGNDGWRKFTVPKLLLDLISASGTDGKISVGGIPRPFQFLVVLLHGQNKRAVTQDRPYE